MCASDSGRRGFSLVEALIALTIVSLVIISGVGAFAAELRVAGQARSAVELDALAQEALTGLILVPGVQLHPLPDSLRKGRFEPPFEGYGWSRAVHAVPGTPDLFDAIIEVTGPERSFSLETRLYRPVLRSSR